MMTEEMPDEFERGVNVAPQKTYTIEQVVAIVKKCKEVWARDSQPLVEALESVANGYGTDADTASQALERFKGMKD